MRKKISEMTPEDKQSFLRATIRATEEEQHVPWSWMERKIPRWGLTPLRKCYDSYISTMNRVDTFLVCTYNPYNSIYFGRA